MPLVKQNLFTLPKHLSSVPPPFFVSFSIDHRMVCPSIYVFLPLGIFQLFNNIVYHLFHDIIQSVHDERYSRISVMCAKLNIYIVITITGSIPRLVDYQSRKGIVRPVVEDMVYQIENIIWLFPYHIPYQSETRISSREFSSRDDIGRGLIRDVIRKEPYPIMFIIYLNMRKSCSVL